MTYNPYAYEMHEDPYPTYARLRAEAPVYRSDEFDFWALSRHEDVLAAFRNVDAFSNSFGVSLDPSAFNPDAHKVMSFLALDPPAAHPDALAGRQGVHADQGQRHGGAHPGDHPRAPDARPRVGQLRLHRRFRRQGADGRDLRTGRGPPADRAELRRLADLVLHRDDGVYDVPPEGMEAALSLVVYYQDMVDQRRRSRTDDLTSALLDAEIDGDKLTDEEIVAFLFLMVVAGNETTTKLLGNAWYWGWRNPDERAKPFADPTSVPEWVEETLRYDTSSQMLLRVTPPAHGDSRARRFPKATGPCSWSDRPTGTSGSFPTPTATTSTATPRPSSASAAGATSAWAPPSPAWRRGSGCTSWCHGWPTTTSTRTGIERVHSINVRGLAALPTTVELR